MAKYASSVKACATCEFWSGSRKVVDFGSNCKIKKDECGSCNYPAKRGVECLGTINCQFWSKWAALR